MRAVVLHEVGPPEALVVAKVPDPAPGEGQVLIDVDYANITFVETQVRAGKPPHSSMLLALLRSAGSSPDELVALTRAALREAERGRLRPIIGQEFELGDAAAAHAAIEGRETIGKTLLRVRR